ncbi:HAD hydrolase-like protein [Pontimonas sp.]|nr:HAD hydrolase-like protein [Pontimonas sp.]MDA8909325.1 HAD hydrolase-like protein [Pontimonas sp.]
MLTYPTILLDLDGTMVDSAPGVVSTIAQTLRELGEPVPDMKELLRWVGPPLPESFEKRAGFSPARTSEAIQVFRSHYIDYGVFDSRVFDGMGEFLRNAKKAGAHLAVATSKPTISATIMLEHFTLSPHFDVICCAADDESRGAKHEVIEDALRGLQDNGLPTDKVIMVGDRIHDVEGARVHGIDTILVRWGYGGPAEWEQAHRVVDTPRQLHELLGVPGSHR